MRTTRKIYSKKVRKILSQKHMTPILFIRPKKIIILVMKLLKRNIMTKNHFGVQQVLSVKWKELFVLLKIIML
ncbi:hypothetical protein B4Q04_02165 [Zobellia sp. OII3]|nr:hypothetical protein B4Q04_02165 [Zobellia sp. OII3]